MLESDPFWPSTQREEANTVGAYCFRCTVREECDNKANRIKAESGIWGGKKRTGS